jgi:molybdopterin-guanine dinucleotide biosynthesis protein A
VVVWREPGEPRHPVAGIVAALRGAAGRPVLVCAADLPLVTVALVRAIAAAPAHGAPAVVPEVGGRLEPLLARYEPTALDALAGADPAAPLREIVSALAPATLALDAAALFNVNTPADLAEAERRLHAQELARGEGKTPRMG